MITTCLHRFQQITLVCLQPNSHPMSELVIYWPTKHAIIGQNRTIIQPMHPTRPTTTAPVPVQCRLIPCKHNMICQNWVGIGLMLMPCLKVPELGQYQPNASARNRLIPAQFWQIVPCLEGCAGKSEHHTVRRPKTSPDLINNVLTWYKMLPSNIRNKSITPETNHYHRWGVMAIPAVTYYWLKHSMWTCHNVPNSELVPAQFRHIMAFQWKIETVCLWHWYDISTMPVPEPGLTHARTRTESAFC